MIDAKIIPLAVLDGVQKQFGEDKVARNRAAFANAPVLRKRSWIGVRISPGNAVAKLKAKLRENHLVTVCEEAWCPNIHECFGRDTATFMILGEVCTRRCSFCDVVHGRPQRPDPLEPAHLAAAIGDMRLRYVVITSVDRDDLRDGGAAHFSARRRAARSDNRAIRIEILTPDFRGKGRMARAGSTCRRPTRRVQPQSRNAARLVSRSASGADYDWSLDLLRRFKEQPRAADHVRHHARPRRNDQSGRRDIERSAGARGRYGHGRQYLQPGAHHHPVLRYWTPDEFKAIEALGYRIGFNHVASDPLVRSSCHADGMARAAGYVEVA